MLEGQDLEQDSVLSDSRGQILSTTFVASGGCWKQGLGEPWRWWGERLLLSDPPQDVPTVGLWEPGHWSEPVASLMEVPDPQTVWDVLH